MSFAATQTRAPLGFTPAERRGPSTVVIAPERFLADRSAAAQTLPDPEVGAPSGQDLYSRSMARRFHVESARTATTTTLKTAQIAVTRLASETSGAGPSTPLPVEKAYIVALQLRDAVGAELWTSGRPAPSAPLLAGSIAIAHLQDEPSINLPQPFDLLLMHIPQIVFDELADGRGAPRIDEFAAEAGTLDPIVHHLGRALLPSLEDPQPGRQLYFDHVAFAIHARLASQYGRLRQGAAPRDGGLTPLQERAAKAALVADLVEEPSLAKVALACGLPVNRLVRAFRQTTGMPPHRWLRSFRVERAKELLLNSSLALAQIAYECGFADQSHFTRVFAGAVGTTPGAWRRRRRA